MFQGFSGSQLVTADVVLGSTGKPIRVFGMHILSGGGGGGVVILRTGIAVGGAIWVQETGTTSTGKTFDYENTGFLFPNGCFVDVDANVTSVLVQFAVEA